MKKGTKVSKTKGDFDIKKYGEAAYVAATFANEPRNSKPPQLGAKTRIWKQDPSVSDLSYRSVYVHTQIKSGPHDSQMTIKGMPPVVANMNGDFLFYPSSEDAFDAVHTYTVVRQTLTMYQRVLGRKIDWQWNQGEENQPLEIYPHAGETANAFYSRKDKALKFFYFSPQNSTDPSNRVYTCRSLDIVAHETGHAILDALKPKWLEQSNIFTRALHEAFSDLTSIFLVLSQLDQVEYIIAQTKANLHYKNILSDIGEEFGHSLGRLSGLRNADNNLKMSEVSGGGEHEVSKVFVGAVYDILADIFAMNRNPRVKDDAIVLYEVGMKVARLVANAFINAPDTNVTYTDVAEEMLNYAQANSVEYKGFLKVIENQFESREVLGPNAITHLHVSFGFIGHRDSCCGTFQDLE